MPKRKRSKELRPAASAAPVAGVAGTTAANTATIKVDSEQERAARLFAESIRTHEAADQAARDRKATAAQQQRQHADLVAAKEAAAARLRRIRADGRPRQQMADAEADYRVALAALTEFETGERPHWAPAVPAAEELSSEAETESDPTSDGDDSAADQPS